jgi:hypothetical protein
MPKYRDMADRLLANSIVDPETGCWIWVGPKFGKVTIYGYVTVKRNGKPVHKAAHRMSYETFIEPIPEGFELDHKLELPCRGGLCIHPNHVEPVTRSENEQRKAARRRQPGEDDE